MALAVEEEKVRERESQRRRDAKAAAESAMLADSRTEVGTFDADDADDDMDDDNDDIVSAARIA
jgi:hypothetical protein